MHAKFAPKTNISQKQYEHLVNDIEHDPLVKHATLTVAAFMAVIAIILGGLIWFAKMSPGNLLQTTGKVTSTASGKTDALGNSTTFVIFDFNTRDGEVKTVRQPALAGLDYQVGQDMKIGYHPKNPNYARLLNDTRPPEISLWLWAVPFVIMVWFIFLALFRHHSRQIEIWNAAEAANADD